MTDYDAGSLLPYLHQVAARRHLDRGQALGAMRALLSEDVPETQIGAFLMALHMKGETAIELAGFAQAIRAAALPVPFVCPPFQTLLDICGTGGDGQNTFNISTTAAFVVAACGILVAKHGNRGVSSLSGSADVLEHLGVAISATGQQAAHALSEAGICFLFAPAFHPRLSRVQRVRRELKMRTVFNLLGPLVSPALPAVQVVGTPTLDAAAQVAASLLELGPRRAYVAHGWDGLDEVSTTGPTELFEVCAGRVQRTTVYPEDFGIERASIEALRGGSPAENAEITLSVLGGALGPRRNIVVVNAALALVAADRAGSWREAVTLASLAIDSGGALARLQKLIASHT